MFNYYLIGLLLITYKSKMTLQAAIARTTHTFEVCDLMLPIA